MRIIADEKIPFLKGILDNYCRVDYLPGHRISRKDLKDTEVLIIRTRTRCDRNLLHGTPVRLIATATIGFDHIDDGYCRMAGIKWTNAPGCNSGSVAQYMLAALLQIAKKQGRPLSQIVIGIIGVGHVGMKVEKIARLLGMRVLLNDPPRARAESNDQFVSLDELLAGSDIISLHVPLNISGIDKTYHLVDRNFIGKCSRKPYLINTSRGEVVDTGAVKAALKDSLLEGAVLDVWENEQVIDREMLRLAHIATPHVAGYSLDGKANGTSMVVKAVSDFCGFGLTGWYPPDVPEPADKEIIIDGAGKTITDILSEATTRSYDILKDDRLLRESPETFEYQRSNYPFRREPGSYCVRLFNDRQDIGSILQKLGFRLIMSQDSRFSNKNLIN
jgi:erythronate-4-phosphate dehydrogenase